MTRKAAVVLVLCLAAVAMLGIGASPAAAAAGGLPQMGTPDIAHVYPDGAWWSGGNGWSGYTDYAPGAPIPAGDFVTMYLSVTDPGKSSWEQIPQILLLSVTVRGAGGEVVAKTTEEQSAQFWGKVEWYPAKAGWWAPWEVPLGQLAAGTYQVTFVVHQTINVEAWTLDTDGNWVSIVIKAFKDIYKSSFTVQ